MFKKILIANRGEIACRIIKTAKKIGIQTVAVYALADKDALHVKSADEAVYLGDSLKDSYLNSPKIISVAKLTNAQAIHPGYGFLSENSDFAKACEKANIIFIGPSSDVIELMGQKDAAKEKIKSLGIPILPGYHDANQDPKKLLEEAKKIKFPILFKAAGGGGGKGMRIVFHEDDFFEKLQAAKRESFASFSNDKIIIEKYLENPRHIEIQIAADEFGNVVHFFERDCSIQRRYQKILEETPAPNLSDSLKEKLYEAAIRIVQTIGYRGVGTLEFLVENESFYFMEMNARLQVEHPVTELITGQDLVAWQLMIAASQPLPCQQNKIKLQGHAIEARLCAEDPDKDYFPSSGKIQYLRWPTVLRVDTGVCEEDFVSVQYDSLLAKLIAFGKTRDEAIDHLMQGLDETFMIGLTTNRNFLKKIISSKDYRQAKLSTQFIPLHHEMLVQTHSLPWNILLPLAGIFLLKTLQKSQVSPWEVLQGFQLHGEPEVSFYFYHAHDTLKVNFRSVAPYYCTSPSFENEIKIEKIDYFPEENRLSIDMLGEEFQAHIIKREEELHLFYKGEYASLTLTPSFSENEEFENENCIRAPIPGTLVAILVNEKDHIKKGQALFVLEAMKMEHSILSPRAGVIDKIAYKLKDKIEEGAEVIIFEN